MAAGAGGESPDAGVYRIETAGRIVFYAFALLLAVVGLGLGALYLGGVDVTGRRPDLGLIGTGLFVLFFVATGAYTAYIARSTRLILSAEGVEYRTPGYRIISGWDNVAAIGPARYPRGGRAESLLLREPSMHAHGVPGALLSLIMPEDATPLRGFGSARSGPLSRDLRRYAPHLLDVERSPEGQAHARQP